MSWSTITPLFSFYETFGEEPLSAFVIVDANQLYLTDC